MLSNLLELAAFALLIAFALVVWPPSALLVGSGGLLLASRASDQ